MGWRDRPYAREDFEPGGPAAGGPRVRMRFGSGFTPAVLWLLIANVAVFIADWLIISRGRPRSILNTWGGLNWVWGVAGGQVWRFVTYMFLHGDLWHVLFNMLALYFFGPTLERRLGLRKFLVFYFACGLSGGVAFLAYGWAIQNPFMYVIGASGAALGLLVGFAILMPHARLIFLIFPIKARTLALILVAVSVLFVLAEPAKGGGVAHAAHLGGIVVAGMWFYVVPRWRGTAGRMSVKIRKGAWERKLKREADEELEVDRILAKIKTHGLASLSGREKRALKQATRRQQEEERRRRQQSRA
jgi:membrane associated rhomboid family serine protease